MADTLQDRTTAMIASLIHRAKRERWTFNQLLDTGAALLPSTAQDAFVAAVVQAAKEDQQFTLDAMRRIVPSKDRSKGG